VVLDEDAARIHAGGERERLLERGRDDARVRDAGRALMVLLDEEPAADAVAARRALELEVQAEDVRPTAAEAQIVMAEAVPHRFSRGRAWTIRRPAMTRHTRAVSDGATISEAIAPLRADPARAGVLLDIDGVLAPIVRHADDAHVPEPTRVPLIAVARRYGLVACVSGRQATTARRIVSLGSITYVGNHGAEMLRGGAGNIELDPEVAKWAPRIREFADEAWTDQLRRLRVRAEDKDVIRAFHWRGAPDEDAAEAAIREIAGRAEEAGLVTHWGRKVLEIRPPVELNKGRGVRRLIEESSLDAAAYVGDDTTDLDAFAALRALVDEKQISHALCVGVTSDETPPELEAQADLLIDGPLGVRTLLAALAA
jgi:trehalose 6-phosphate phosphatase